MVGPPFAVRGWRLCFVPIQPSPHDADGRVFGRPFATSHERRHAMSDNDTNPQDPNDLKAKLIFVVVALLLIGCAKVFLGM